MINIEYGIVNENGISVKERKVFTKQEFEELKEEISDFLKEIETSNDLNDIQSKIYGNQFHLRFPLLSKILAFLSVYNLPRTRTFIASFGYGFKINPLRDHELDIYKPINCWHYCPKSDFYPQAMTVMMRPLPFKVKVLTGMQIGIMTQFLGIYIFISQPFPQKSFTLFIGSARSVFSLDLSPPFPI